MICVNAVVTVREKQALCEYILIVFHKSPCSHCKQLKMSSNASSLFSLLYQTKDTYKLIIKASDLGGRAGGNTGTGEITINIMDINDNVPTLEKESVGFTYFYFHFFSIVLYCVL